MQIASRQPLWNNGRKGTVVTVEMTDATGLYIKFLSNTIEGVPVVVSWGDGSRDTYPDASESGNNFTYDHTYAKTGRYRITISGIGSIGFRSLDGERQYSYDAAVTSVVDYAGQIKQSRSGAFKNATNLTEYIAPSCMWMGQRDFAYCRKLKKVVIGESDIYYDGTFQYCSALVDFTTKRSWTCWSYVWQGCTALEELHLGEVNQFATNDFGSTPNLMDIWIDNKTVDQIKQVATKGNIVSGYGAKFPWGANASCRFHGTDGVVLGNGTVIEKF